MKDKQVYRNLTNVTQEDLNTVKNNFKWITNQLENLTPVTSALVIFSIPYVNISRLIGLFKIKEVQLLF